MYRYPDAVLLVFCKAPVPGQVKTRLLTEISAVEAADLQRELCLRTMAIATQDRLCEVQLFCAPSDDHPFFDRIRRDFGVKSFSQQGASLGERMHAAFVFALARFRYAILVGCDCPSLTGADIEAAIIALGQANKQCVIAPAEDGGYVLIGLSDPHIDLFSTMPWGTSQVASPTYDRLAKLGLSYQTLGMQWDVDTASDLERYRANRLI